MNADSVPFNVKPVIVTVHSWQQDRNVLWLVSDDTGHFYGLWMIVINLGSTLETLSHICCTKYKKLLKIFLLLDRHKVEELWPAQG